MFEPIIRWLRLNVPGVEQLWVRLNRKKIMRDRDRFEKIVENYRKKKESDR